MDPSPRRNPIRHFRPGILALLLLLLAPLACSHRAGEEEIASPEVPTIEAKTGTVARRDLVERLLVRGPVVALPNQDVKIASQVAGRVVEMKVAEGDRVRAGQLLAQIETRPLEEQKRAATAALAQAQTALSNAGLNLTRTERLFERGIAAGKEVEDARTERAAAASALEAARTALEAAARQLTRARVVSPIAGQVVKRFVGVGEQVDGTAAQPLVEVANLQRVEIAAQVPAEHLGRVREGQTAQVSLAAAEGRLEGRVVAIAPALDAGTNAALVRIAAANAGGLARVGMLAEARIALQTRPKALTVPPEAIANGERGTAVYAVSGDVATRTPVTVGLATPDAVEVVSGLAEGQTVLVSAVHGLGEKARLASRP